MDTQDRTDVYTRITSEIEAGAGEWRMPWHHDGSSIARPTNISSGKAYRGVNTLALWIAAQANGFGSGIWGTYRQWQALDAQVRKGERATTVVLWKEFAARSDDDAVGEDERPPRRLFARAFSVFNSSQVEGFTPPAAPILPDSERIPDAEAFISALGIPVTFGPRLHTTASILTTFLCRTSMSSAMLSLTSALMSMRLRMPRAPSIGSIETSPNTLLARPWQSKN